MESHSTEDLMQCCMMQIDPDSIEENNEICPNCKYDIKKHSGLELVECTLAFLKSAIKN